MLWLKRSSPTVSYTHLDVYKRQVNILECVRRSSCVKSFLNVTTDKVYHNNEWEWGYRENEPLDGFDPYSNSKSCSELVLSLIHISFGAVYKARTSGPLRYFESGSGEFGTISKQNMKNAMTCSCLLYTSSFFVIPVKSALPVLLGFNRACLSSPFCR